MGILFIYLIILLIQFFIGSASAKSVNDYSNYFTFSKNRRNNPEYRAPCFYLWGRVHRFDLSDKPRFTNCAGDGGIFLHEVV